MYQTILVLDKLFLKYEGGGGGGGGQIDSPSASLVRVKNIIILERFQQLIVIITQLDVSQIIFISKYAIK